MWSTLTTLIVLNTVEQVEDKKLLIVNWRVSDLFGYLFLGQISVMVIYSIAEKFVGLLL